MVRSRTLERKINRMLNLFRDSWSFISALFERMDEIHMSLIAAGVAFYAMFAVFPGLAAIITLWRLWFDPMVIMKYMDIADEFIPNEAAQILHSQVNAFTTGGGIQLGASSAISFIIATIAARAGVTALISGLNATYGMRSHSTIFGFILAYILTLAMVAIVLIGLATIVVVPIALNFFPASSLRSWLVSSLPWGSLFLIVLVAIGILYRYGPNVKMPRTPIFTWGSLFAAISWAAASVAFSLYLSSFNSYNFIYGSIGAVAALLMWFYLAGFSVLLGALINVELARLKRIRVARSARNPEDEAASSRG